MPTERTIIAQLSGQKTAEDARQDIRLLRKYRGGSLPTPEYWAGLLEELRDWAEGIERLQAIQEAYGRAPAKVFSKP